VAAAVLPALKDPVEVALKRPKSGNLHNIPH
jgi:hypothetical protein